LSSILNRLTKLKSGSSSHSQAQSTGSLTPHVQESPPKISAKNVSKNNTITSNKIKDISNYSIDKESSSIKSLNSKTDETK